MDYKVDYEVKQVKRNGVALLFVREDEAAKHGYQETSLRPDEIALDWNRWASFNVYVRETGQTWVLAANRLTLGDLAKFAYGDEYLRKVDFALPRSNPFWLGWDYNTQDIFGEALTAQSVMAQYHRAAKSGLI